MHIAFLVLKIILLALGILLGLLIILFLLLMIVPVRYRIDADWQEPPDVRIRISWMAFFVRFQAHYQGKLQYTLRSFGILLASDQMEKHDKKQQIKETDDDDFEQFMREQDAETMLPTIDVSGVQQWDQTEPWPIWRYIRNFWNGFAFLITLPAKTVMYLFIGIRRILDAVSHVDHIRSKIISRLKRINKKRDMLLRWYQVPTTKTAIAHGKQMIWKVVRIVRPNHIQGTMRIGFEDPAVTGQFFGILGLLLPLYYDKIDITADFERAVLQGDIHMRGHIRIGSLLCIVIQICFDKYIRVTYERFRKITGGSNHGK